MRLSRVLSLLVLPSVLIAGCQVIGPPPPESVLAGTWRLETTSPSGLGETTFTFDTNGNLQTVVFTPVQGVQITRSEPLSDTTVNGDSVGVSVNLLIIGTLSFNGTLSSDGKTITGQLTTDLNLGLTHIKIDNGQATLTKVE